MIIVTTATISADALDRIIEHVETAGLRTHVSRGEHRTIVGCIGDEGRLSEHGLTQLEGVERVLPVLKPYKLASREFSVGDTAIRFGDPADTVIGGRDIVVIAGPCSVEGEAMMHETAHHVQRAGARLLRGGAFKPRSSPYAFQGMGEAGLKIMADVRAETGMPIVTEVMDPRQVELVASYADVLQIGARNMQNFTLLTEVGKVQRPVLLKRGLSGTITELLMAAEYIMAQGNGDVILCERGIRTYETATRNTMDIAAIPVLKRESHLPVIVDPSHAGGRASLVAPLAMAAIAAGADGLIVEVHPTPATAKSDGEQSLEPSAFASMMQQVQAVAQAVGRGCPWTEPVVA
ncbi:MAG TPA: 3-deoxy-7-phosphoheptulonate synthase [Gemmatimonas aurantiaca]|jgi:3-deoxy-7-phosphoheptulonate synthase|uniref:Phospho-2-dehydro-3-deoxyheptonate aldolase n=2 Tax=Gemmatimonas aurantiaca TaxID=173480 RepID=C1AEG0_GEMAT|nr:3-deoxy-7-phosphoheptulonate synthase [Gemmatimonas aurantiaca]BAH40887.1 phospho-2-dehydro-3-deoxyheptonate aldolase [Gemmatimonas aurantiaca T-27]HCT59018.1 3-deoxy-7-phosphoheptulonate synthase [Gemmatimonas aurantiaca]